jgi:hypothetical protein
MPMSTKPRPRPLAGEGMSRTRGVERRRCARGRAAGRAAPAHVLRGSVPRTGSVGRGVAVGAWRQLRKGQGPIGALSSRSSTTVRFWLGIDIASAWRPAHSPCFATRLIVTRAPRGCSGTGAVVSVLSSLRRLNDRLLVCGYTRGNRLVVRVHAHDFLSRDGSLGSPPMTEPRKPRKASWRELPPGEMAAHLLATPTISDRAGRRSRACPRKRARTSCVASCSA